MVSHRDCPTKVVQCEAAASWPACVNALATVSVWRDMLPGLVSGYSAAAIVLAAHFLIAVASVREKSNTYDELGHITAGFSYWMYNDYRLDPENGNLPKRWCTLPLLALGLNFPEDQVSWTACDFGTLGRRFFFESGNDLLRLLWRPRCMNAIQSAGL